MLSLGRAAGRDRGLVCSQQGHHWGSPGGDHVIRGTRNQCLPVSPGSRRSLTCARVFTSRRVLGLCLLASQLAGETGRTRSSVLASGQVLHLPQLGKETVGLDFSPPTVNVAAVAVASKVRNRLCSHRLWTEGREVLGWTELGLPWRCQRPWQNRRRSSCRL